MTKSQILILLLIIALAFYLTQENQPKSPPSLVKKPPKPQLPKSTSVILPAAEPIKLPNLAELLNQGWPAHFPSAQSVKEPNHPELSQFKGLNPPHSQVAEPFEPPKPPEPEPKTRNCPAAEFTPNPENVQAPEPSSLLTPKEKTQRLTQEQSDYHWLLNHRTIDYWHHEHKLTNSQYQVLASLVGYEEMNTLSYFLNYLPVNYEWLLISSEFKNPTLIEQWKSNFTYQQTQDWIKIGLQPTDYALATWLQNTKHLTPEEALNTQDFEQLKAEFAHYGN
jgi:hypothetical protein